MYKTGLRISYYNMLPTSPWAFIAFFCLVSIENTSANFAKSFYIHWNTTNSMFRIDNTDHIIDLNKGNAQFEYDQVNIICPVYTPGTIDVDAEKYIIYNVSKDEYETCRITNPNPRIIAVCDKPHKLMFFTITVRPFSPQPGGLEFLPGKDYFFISTSSKDDLHRRIGGRCMSHNMKMVFHVCCKPEDEPKKIATLPPVMASPPTPPPPPVTLAPETVAPPSRKPISNNKKIHKYDKAPNEVVKSEELSYSSCSRATVAYVTSLAAIVLLLR